MDNQHPSWIGGKIAAKAISDFLINDNLIPLDVSTEEAEEGR
ncbi:MAG: hypothetical protein U9Q67_03535 [Patescibacteria group bacterium]|nr:hypothetical protein [Patescibacteria group bacterium]